MITAMAGVKNYQKKVSVSVVEDKVGKAIIGNSCQNFMTCFRKKKGQVPIQCSGITNQKSIGKFCIVKDQEDLLSQ